MNFPIVKEYRDDIRNVLIENKVKKEPFAVEAGKWTRIIVPVHAPFFVKSLEMFNGNMEPLVPGEDYRIYSLMSGLTELTAKPVACFIELLKEDITEGFLSYDVVGEFSLFDSAFLQLALNAINDERPVWWDNLTNKPVVFRPKLHGHSLLYEVVAFTDTVKLIDGILGLLKSDSRTAIEVKFDHFLRLLNHYIGVYKTELINYLTRHINAYDAHGLAKDQVNLGLVDNFATAQGDEILQPRRDLHLTPAGLRGIMGAYGFNSEELMPANQLPIAQFGNSNFIPPSIDGSFEGLGGKSETAAIAMESDGSLVFLWNRMDGRIDGLYYSVVQTPYNNPRQLYTSYKYDHQRFRADGITPDRIAAGSGDEVILVGDSRKRRFYIGVANGTLDPAKHVYSEINLDALKTHLPAPSNVNLGVWFGRMNVVLMGSWIYIFFAHGYKNGESAFGAAISWRNISRQPTLRYVYRVPLASVKAQINVTATPVNVSFTDADGVAWSNSPSWRWCTPQLVDMGDDLPWFRKFYHTFDPAHPVSGVGPYRSQLTFACPIPSKPGKFLLRFSSGSYLIDQLGVGTRFQGYLEMLYEFDPTTNQMVLLSKTQPQTITWPYTQWDGNSQLTALVHSDTEQGAVVLANGDVVASVGRYQGFPRGWVMCQLNGRNSKFDVMNSGWDVAGAPVITNRGSSEIIVSPIKSSISPKGFLLGNGGDFYHATPSAEDGVSTTINKLYYRRSAGKLAVRANVNNLFVNNVVSRPLSNQVYEVNLDARVGGAYVTVPASQLDSFGIDVGENTFCMGVQKKYTTWEANGLPAGTNPDDVMLVSRHTNQFNADGTLTVIPTATILWPQTIVNQLKQQASDLVSMNASPKVIVTICDPTGALTDKFGWLPVLVMLTYVSYEGRMLHNDFFHVVPTYTGPANARVVSSFTIDPADKRFRHVSNNAIEQTPTDWVGQINGNLNTTRFGAMRVGYYLSGNVIRGFFDTGIQSTHIGDSGQVTGTFTFLDRTTRRWASETTITRSGQSGGAGNRTVTPDNGVSMLYGYDATTGGAGSIYQGSTNNPLLGSVYPELGWTIFAQSEVPVVFNGRRYILPPGTLDLRDTVADPANKTFYLYAVLINGVPTYEVGEEKRLESPFQVWVGKVVTSASQILTIERFNVFTVNGNRVSEIKRGNAIPASSGLANTEGQFPWLRSDELLP